MLHKKIRHSLSRKLNYRVSRDAARRAPGRRDRESGQSLVELALVTPIIFFLVVNIVNFGAFLYEWITVVNAARAAVQYVALNGQSAGSPIFLSSLSTSSSASAPYGTTTSLYALQHMIFTETASLPGVVTSGSSPNPTFTACYKQGTSTAYYSYVASSGSAVACSAAASPATDPESAYSFTTVKVTVSYTPTQIYSIFGFAHFGLSRLTALPSPIAVSETMRVLE